MGDDMIKVEVLASTMSDNFFYLLVQGNLAYAIDPVDASVAAAALDERALTLQGIVNTHWHPDHVGGNAELRSAFPECEVIMPAAEQEMIESLGGTQATRTVEPGDTLKLGSAPLKVHALPGHTMGHVAYEVGTHLLSGDVVFGAGIGHCRSGDVGLAHASIRRLVEEFSPDLTLYPGHDYLVRNAEFADQVGVSNAALREQAARFSGSPARELITTTLGEEMSYNPFLRTHEPEVQEAMRAHDGGATWAAHAESGRSDSEITFRALRALRDNF